MNLIDQVKAYALDHYSEGWDVIVECYSDAQLSEEIGRFGNPARATLAEVVGAFEAAPGPVWAWLHQQRETAWGGPDDSPY